MRIAKILFTLGTLAATAAAQAPPGPQQNAPASQQNPPAKPPTPAPAPIKTNTRLITVDVIATDSHGKVVRGLKPEDFQISEEHGAQQKIEKFQFVDASAPRPPATTNSPLAAPPSAPYMYSNILPQQMRVPPTVILMDALNTSIQDQLDVHRQMVMLLKTLPASTPIAVFVLGHNLHVVQNFTTDPALLRSAVDKTLRSPDIEQNPKDDANSPSNLALDLNGDSETFATRALEDFERTEFEGQMTIRVDETSDAMVSISKFLGGYPGRKNLLWFSESFPIWIAPSSDFGSDSFNGTADYSDKVRRASEALTDARIAVYPVDARGLETAQLSSVAQDPHINRNNPGAGFGGQLNRDSNERLDAQATMQQIAEQTGGKTCENNNDLSGCVQGALDDSSTYYELAYYPENVKWDGKFHKITVKSNQHGIKLRYRTGYFATNPTTLSRQSPDKLLQQACMDPLSSTAVSLTVETIAPKQGAVGPGARYLLTISPNSLSIAPAGQLNLQMAICEYDPKGESFQFFPRDLSTPVTEAAYQGWKANGIRNIFDYDAKSDDRRLRFAVLDVPSGATGSVDVPAHPREFGSIPTAGTPAIPAGNSSGAARSTSPVAGAAPPPVVPRIVFHGASGRSSMLDWTGDSLTYRGDLGLGEGAQALFGIIFGSHYHCETGSLIPNDVTSTAKPSFVLTLTKPGAGSAVIDLGGDAPAYSGQVPVDSSGRAFFDYLWKLCHCQQP